MGCTLCDHNGVTLTAVHPSSFQIWCRCHTVVTNDIDTCKRMILRYFSAKILGSNCNLSLDEQPCERVEFLQAANLLKATAGVGQHHELWVWGHSHPPQVKLSEKDVDDASIDDVFPFRPDLSEEKPPTHYYRWVLMTLELLMICDLIKLSFNNFEQVVCNDLRMANDFCD